MIYKLENLCQVDHKITPKTKITKTTTTTNAADFLGRSFTPGFHQKITGGTQNKESGSEKKKKFQ